MLRPVTTNLSDAQRHEVEWLRPIGAEPEPAFARRSVRRLTLLLAQPNGWRLVASLAAVYLIWSSTYLGMKIALGTFPPMVLGTLSVIEVGLNALGIPHGKGGAQAAIDWLGEQVKA